MTRSVWRRLALHLGVLTLVACMWAVPAFASVSGAIWTTDASGTVNENFYPYKNAVWLNGGPTKTGGSGLTPGDYYVQITSPDGATVLGRSWSSAQTAATGHVIHVGADGYFPESYHLWEWLYSGSSGFTLMGYDNTPNNGGEYKVWASTSADFLNADTKTDNFKVEDYKILKTWQVRVPSELWLNSNLKVRAWYSVQGPEPEPTNDWDFVDLVKDTTRPGYFTAITEFDNPVSLWYYFDVAIVNGGVRELELITDVAGPEALTAESSPYLNEIEVALKRWDFRVPSELVERGIDVIKAQYRLDSDTIWTDVPLSDDDPADGVYSALTLFLDPTHITYRFVLESGDFALTTASTEETITGVATNVNDMKVSLKRWDFQVPSELLARGDTTVTARYSPNGSAPWTSVVLGDEGGGVFSAETLFLDPTHIHWNFMLENAGETFVTPSQEETISGVATNVNAASVSLKRWNFQAPAELLPHITSVKAQYRIAPETAWTDVTLSDAPSVDGTFTADTLFLDPVGSMDYRFVVATDNLGTKTTATQTETFGPHGFKTNSVSLSLKHWNFQAPADLLSHITSVKAQYRIAPETAWTDVTLSDAPSVDGTFTADTLFFDPVGSMDYRFVVATDIMGTKTTATQTETFGPHAVKNNSVSISLKRWNFQAPVEMVGYIVSVKAQYRFDAGDPWTDVILNDGTSGGDGIYGAETLFFDPVTDMEYRFVIDAGSLGTKTTESQTESFGPHGVKDNDITASLKRWNFSAPVELVSYITSVTAQYRFGPTEDWNNVVLGDGADIGDGMYTADTLLLDPVVDMEYRFVINAGTLGTKTTDSQTESFGPHVMKVNPITVSMKRWNLTIPDDLIGKTITTIKAQWRMDPADDWTDVPLTDGTPAGDGIYSADSFFIDNVHLYYRFVFVSGDFSITTEEKEESFGPTVLKVNPLALSLKHWILTPSAALEGLPGVTYLAQYSTVDPTDPSFTGWTDVSLTKVDGPPITYEADTLFLDPTDIWWRFDVTGSTGGTEYYHWTSKVGTETITGTATITNAATVVNGIKTWRLHVMKPTAGATYYGAWSVDQVTWFEVALTEELPDFPGLFTGSSTIPDGMTFYWKIYGKTGGNVFWTTEVGGPETMTIDGLVNEYWLYGAPRTIGYWQNWMNHFSATQMDAIVAEVNSDANGFSTVFTSGALGDVGQYTLASGVKKKTATNTAVAYYLGEAQNASLMYQMLRAQLLGVELNVACGQTDQTPRNGELVGLLPAQPVYLTKLPGYTSNPAINPWGSDAVVPVGDIISTIEAASAGNWSGWTREMQAFAKNVCDAINNAENAGGILAP